MIQWIKSKIYKNYIPASIADDLYDALREQYIENRDKTELIQKYEDTLYILRDLAYTEHNQEYLDIINRCFLGLNHKPKYKRCKYRGKVGVESMRVEKGWGVKND